MEAHTISISLTLEDLKYAILYFVKERYSIRDQESLETEFDFVTTELNGNVDGVSLTIHGIRYRNRPDGLDQFIINN